MPWVRFTGKSLSWGFRHTRLYFWNPLREGGKNCKVVWREPSPSAPHLNPSLAVSFMGSNPQGKVLLISRG
jgi:hypothetical protein